MHLSLEASVKPRDCGQKTIKPHCDRKRLFGGGRMA
jgi:hypothetical protein